MKKKSVIAFLGAGNMAEALIGGLLATKIFKKEAIVATDVVKERLEYMKKKFGISIVGSSAEAVQKASILLLAVKPQNMKDLMHEIAPWLDEGKLVVSIAAGMRTQKLEEFSGKNLRLVRVMPNMPALVRSGISVIYRGKNATEEDGQTASEILKAVGDVLETTDENWLDAVTALSGSGPAYFFYFIEALVHAGESMGISSAMARQLVLSTASGSLELLRQTKESPDMLRRKVTSPGGTTEAAIKVLDGADFQSLVAGALKAAADRSRELSK